MLKFLFRGKATMPEVVIEADRARFTRLVREINGMIDTLPTKPRVTLDPATGHILPETPEQFADEALALPAPETSATDQGADQDANEDGDQGVDEGGDQGADRGAQRPDTAAAKAS